MSLTKINPRGQITIPTKFRDILNCKPGDYVEVVMEGKILKLYSKNWLIKSRRGSGQKNTKEKNKKQN